MKCLWFLMQHVLLCFSQFTDTRQDRHWRLRGGLQGTVRERRVRIPVAVPARISAALGPLGPGL